MSEMADKGIGCRCGWPLDSCNPAHAMGQPCDKARVQQDRLEAGQLSPEAFDLLRKLVSEAIATGKRWWTMDEYNENRKAWEELDRSKLTRSGMYQVTGLKPKAVRLALGWSDETF